MKSLTVAAAVFCGLTSAQGVSAQGPDPNLLREADAVRTVLADNKAALGAYTWTERTDVLVDGKLQSTTDMLCRYDSSGAITKVPLADPNAPKDKKASAVSNRPMVRKKAAMQDYIERAMSLIHNYLPPNPERITAMLQNGTASLGPSEGGKSEIRFSRYFMAGDSMVFKYDTASKALVHGSIKATLGDKKDPVTLEADFATLPGGLTHLHSTTLDAKVKKVQVKTSNIDYKKISN